MKDAKQSNFYKILLEAWFNEIEEEGLTEIPLNIYNETQEYLKRLKGKEELPKEIRKAEEEFIRKLILSLFKVRVLKLIVSFVSGEIVELSKLPPEEQEFFNDFRIAFEKVVAKFVQSDKNEENQKLAKTINNYVLVRFISSATRFIGADKNVYGPFEREDVALIPASDAEDLISKGLALKIATGV